MRINKPLAMGICSAALMFVVLAGLTFAKLELGSRELSGYEDKPLIAENTVNNKTNLVGMLMGSLAIYGGLGRLMFYMFKSQPSAPDNQRRRLA